MARLASSRLTTSIKVQISRERQRDRTLQTSTENATELVATLKSNKTKKSQTLITQDVKTLVVLDWRNIETRQPTDVKRRELGHM